MRLETTKDIIIQSKKFHNLLAEYYHNLSSKSDKVRIKILLDYLEEKERQFENTFTELEFDTPSKVLNNWFSHSSCEQKFKELARLISDESPSIERIIDIFTEVDNCLIDLYESFAESSNNKEVVDFFRSLVKLEENHKIKALKNAAQLNDL